MKIWENNIHKRIREMSVVKIQFGFMPGDSTLETMFCVRQLEGKYRKKKNIFMVSINLERFYDRRSREILKWAC